MEKENIQLELVHSELEVNSGERRWCEKQTHKHLKKKLNEKNLYMKKRKYRLWLYIYSTVQM